MEMEPCLRCKHIGGTSGVGCGMCMTKGMEGRVPVLLNVLYALHANELQFRGPCDYKLMDRLKAIVKAHIKKERSDGVTRDLPPS
jgi:hypothetical protein